MGGWVGGDDVSTHTRATPLFSHPHPPQDPFNLPTGRTIPPGLAAALSEADAAASLPARAAPGAPPPPRPRYSSGRGAGVAAAASSSSPSPTRRVLAVFIGGGGPLKPPRWLPPASLLPWAARRADTDSGGGDAATATYYARAVAEAAAIVQAKADMSAAARGGATPSHSLTAARTASASAAARAFQARAAARCGRCAACTGAAGRDRRCLVARVAAASEAGHVGAQVAALGHGAVGGRIALWWAGDGAWYAGTVVAFDEQRQRHTLAYDDGFVESTPLWSPSNLVTLDSNPLDWPANAAIVAAERAGVLAGMGGEAAAAAAAGAAVARAAAAAERAGGGGDAPRPPPSSAAAGTATAAAAAAGATRAPTAAALAALAVRGRASRPPATALAPPSLATWRGGGPSRDRERCPSFSKLHRGGCGTATAEHWCERRGGGGPTPPRRRARAASPSPPAADGDDGGDADDARAAVTTRSGRAATRFRFGSGGNRAPPARPLVALPPAADTAPVAHTGPHPALLEAVAAVAGAAWGPSSPPPRVGARCAVCVAAKKGRCGADGCYPRCLRRFLGRAPPPVPPPVVVETAAHLPLSDDAPSAALAPPPSKRARVNDGEPFSSAAADASGASTDDTVAANG